MIDEGGEEHAFLSASAAKVSSTNVKQQNIFFEQDDIDIEDDDEPEDQAAVDVFRGIVDVGPHEPQRSPNTPRLNFRDLAMEKDGAIPLAAPAGSPPCAQTTSSKSKVWLLLDERKISASMVNDPR